MQATSEAQTSTVGRRRNLLVITGRAEATAEHGDRVSLFVDGDWVSGAPIAGGVKSEFGASGASLPAGSTYHAAAFRDVTEGPARIHVRPPEGTERFYCITIGEGYCVPWHLSWRYRGWEAYWCG